MHDCVCQAGWRALTGIYHAAGAMHGIILAVLQGDEGQEMRHF
jgi:hypothetical protein